MKKEIVALMTAGSMILGLTSCSQLAKYMDKANEASEKLKKEAEEDEEDENEEPSESEASETTTVETTKPRATESETEATTSSASAGVLNIDSMNSAYREVLQNYEDEMRRIEDVQYGSMDSCAICDITGDGFPELLIIYCADDEYGLDWGGSYYACADIRIFTVIPGESTATEMLHVPYAVVNAGGGTYTDVVLLNNGNLLVETDGGDEDWTYSYTEYAVDGYTLQPVYTMECYSYPDEETYEYIYEYTLNGQAATEEEYNAQLNNYMSMFSSVLVMQAFYNTEYTSSSDWVNAVISSQNNFLSYDEAWEVTA